MDEEQSHFQQAEGLMTRIADYFEETGKWSSEALTQHASSVKLPSQLVEYSDEFEDYSLQEGEQAQEQSDFDYVLEEDDVNSKDFKVNSEEVPQETPDVVDQ